MLMLKSVTAILSPMVPQYILTTSARLITLPHDLDTQSRIPFILCSCCSSPGNTSSPRPSKFHPLAQFNHHILLRFSYHPFKFSLSFNHTQLYTHMTIWRLLMITHISVFLLHKRITFPCPLYKQAGPRDKFWLIDCIWR